VKKNVIQRERTSFNQKDSVREDDSSKRRSLQRGRFLRKEISSDTRVPQKEISSDRRFLHENDFLRETNLFFGETNLVGSVPWACRRASAAAG
jgi:hypothetical protein